MNILVYIEKKDNKAVTGSLELISAAKELGLAKAVCIGAECEDVAQVIAGYGIDVMAMESVEGCADAVLAVLEQAVKETDSQLVLFSATQSGKDLAPRLAARLNTGCVTDVVAVKEEAGSLQFVRPAYGGTILETMVFAAGKSMVVSVRAGSFKKPELNGAGSVIMRKAEIPADAIRAKLVETTIEIAEMVNLEGADVIVAGGRGCGNQETFRLVEELAALLGGVVGASRPAIEEGLVSRAHQIGQSGKIVAPKLYIACGISGAMQHVSGMTGSDYIVAVNKDEDAPIFEVSDVSIVGRCEEILPLMIDEIKKRKA